MGVFLALLPSCTFTAPQKTEHTKSNCVINFSSDTALEPYVNLLANAPKITEAIDFCHTSDSFQEILWDKIKQAEETGTSPTAPLPSAFHSASYSPEADKWNLQITRQEAEEIYAAHVAHALWIDQHNIVPWKLSEYRPEELEKLLAPKAWFPSWSAEDNKYGFSLILDHSPFIAYSVVKQMVDPASLTDQESALVEILKSLRLFRHGAIFKNSDGEMVCADPQEIVTMDQMFQEKVSRYGCQTMAPFFVQLANALNIPGETVRGYFAEGGHRTALFELTDDVLAHGDDVYSQFFMNTPSREMMDSYQFWEEEVMSYPKGHPQEAHNSQINNQENSLTYISKNLMNEYCKLGRPFLNDYFGNYAAKERIDVLESEIAHHTKNCTANPPEDNPDGTGPYLNNVECLGQTMNLHYLTIIPHSCRTSE